MGVLLRIGVKVGIFCMLEINVLNAILGKEGSERTSR